MRGEETETRIGRIIEVTTDGAQDLLIDDAGSLRQTRTLQAETIAQESERIATLVERVAVMREGGIETVVEKIVERQEGTLDVTTTIGLQEEIVICSRTAWIEDQLDVKEDFRNPTVMNLPCKQKRGALAPHQGRKNLLLTLQTRSIYYTESED